MNIRRFRVLHEAGASYAEIARECGLDGALFVGASPRAHPSASSRAGTQPRVLEPFVELIDDWLRKDVSLKGSVIHERPAGQHGSTGSYHRVEVHLVEARPRIAAELAAEDENPLDGLHRRFEVVPGVHG